MTDRYQKIRDALAKGPTPGPWELRDGRTDTVENAQGYPVCTVNYHPDERYSHGTRAAYIAACDPDTIRALLEERDALREVSRYAAIGGFDRSDPEQMAEALANARLIAAAPELLAALEGMEKWASRIYDGYPPSTASIAAAPYREAARAAIAASTGQEAKP